MKTFHDWMRNITEVKFLQIYIPIVLGIIGGGFVLVEYITSGNVQGLWLNLGTEVLGAAGTYVILTLLLGRREKQQEEETAKAEIKARLIRQMGSNVRDVAVQAVNELRAHGWLTDGSLTEQYLLEANLQGAYLEHASLQQAKLSQANLQKADLRQANLRRTSLALANLQEANLRNADLWKAGLAHAILKGANLEGANLQEADFVLSRADLLFDEKTILPDKTRWASSTNLSRFTNPNHPNFWRSDDPGSPAYRGEKSLPQEAASPNAKPRKQGKKSE